MGLGISRHASRVAVADFVEIVPCASVTVKKPARDAPGVIFSGPWNCLRDVSCERELFGDIEM